MVIQLVTFRGIREAVVGLVLDSAGSPSVTPLFIIIILVISIVMINIKVIVVVLIIISLRHTFERHH